MTFTILLIGSAFAFAAMAVVASRGSAVHTALAGDNTAVGLKDAATDTLVGGSSRPSATLSDWQLTTVNDLTAAEDLLDCLEANGIENREVIVLGNSCFAVRWR